MQENTEEDEFSEQFWTLIESHSYLVSQSITIILYIYIILPLVPVLYLLYDLFSNLKKRASAGAFIRYKQIQLTHWVFYTSKHDPCDLETFLL